PPHSRLPPPPSRRSSPAKLVAEKILRIGKFWPILKMGSPNGYDLGSVSGDLFTLNTQLAQQFEQSETGAALANSFLDSKLQMIKAAIEKIAKARGYNLSRNADKEALRSYLKDEENQDEISQFMEEAQSQ
ncbi:MAG: hypothetical protein ACREOO_29830, partial [bacterium]